VIMGCSFSQTLQTVNGLEIHYEKLCICSGSRPKLLTQDNPYVLGIRDTNCAQVLDNAKRIVVVGNGGIAKCEFEVGGCEVIIGNTFFDVGRAATCKRARYTIEGAAATQGLAVSGNRQGQSRGLEEPGSALGPYWHEGISLRGAEEVSVPLCVHNVILHLNVITLARLLAQTASRAASSEHAQTSWLDIFNRSLSQSAVPTCFKMATIARQVGWYAGRCMSADILSETIELDICFELFSHFLKKIPNFIVVLLGKFNGQGLGLNQELLVRCIKEHEYVKMVLSGGRMLAAVFIGETDLEETFENLILNQMDLTPYREELLNPNIEDYFD
uniref:Pyridine nucleotide-disulphide oxidoreductase domain 1 n=1 Tax=Oncorhynchus tshawytscha TaxID=74940 RepID=A0AAZ3QUG4_ONCTS